MRLPSPTLSADERALLDAVAAHGGDQYAVPAPELRRYLGLTTMQLARLAWALQDPRRFSADLLFIDERYNPALVRLTPEALEALAGAVPVEPKLTAAIATGTKVVADPDAVDQLLLSDQSS